MSGNRQARKSARSLSPCTMRNCARFLPHGMQRHNNVSVPVLRHQERSKGENRGPLDGSGLTYTIHIQFLLPKPPRLLMIVGVFFCPLRDDADLNPHASMPAEEVWQTSEKHGT